MAKTKLKLKDIIAARLIYVYLLIFPLGQLLRLDVEIVGKSITIHPIDVIAGLSLVFLLIPGTKKPKILNNFYSFLSVAAFSLLFSFTIFSNNEILVGSLYFLRLFAYVGLFAAAWSFAKKEKQKSLVLNALIITAIFVAVYGWIQYFWIPDLRDLKYLGWDDHYFRLTGTFLDPGFTGIILVLGFFATSAKYLKTNSRKLLPVLLLFIVSVIFTYSRASYLSLFAGLFVLFFVVKRGVKIIAALVLISFLVIIPFIPRGLTEGAQLERTHSILAKFDDYKRTLSIFRTNPVFGVGFNNICSARGDSFSVVSGESNSCSGSDSSLLLVLATTGVVGFIVLLRTVRVTISSVSRSVNGLAFLASTAGLAVHSLFLNSLFYPWIMGWMAILLAISLKKSKES